MPILNPADEITNFVLGAVKEVVVLREKKR